MTAVPLRPLFKCVGGKGKLAPTIAGYIPAELGVLRSYSETCLGGAALLCALVNSGRITRDTALYIGDADPNIMSVYSAIRDDAIGFAAQCTEAAARYAESTTARKQALYYNYRDAWNAGDRTPLRMLVLRAASFNGLWRVNKSGQLNAPWGKRAKIALPSQELLHAWQPYLRNAVMHTGDFATLLGPPYPVRGRGDVVYLDPPYIGTFTGYTKNGFSVEDQGRLLTLANQLYRAGACVLVSAAYSTAAVNFAEHMWPGAAPFTLSTRYSVAARSEARGAATELLLVGA